MEIARKRQRDAYVTLGAALAGVGLGLAILTHLLIANGWLGTWAFGAAALGLLAGTVGVVLSALSIASEGQGARMPILVCGIGIVAFAVFGYSFVGVSGAASAQNAWTLADAPITIARPEAVAGAQLALTGSVEPTDDAVLADTGRLAETRRTGSRTAPLLPGTAIRQHGWEVAVSAPRWQDDSWLVALTVTRTAPEPGDLWADVSLQHVSPSGVLLDALPVNVAPPADDDVNRTDLASGETATVHAVIPVARAELGLIQLRVGTDIPVYFAAR